MGSRYKILIIVSIALAMFYAMPWVAVLEENRFRGNTFAAMGLSAGRIIYLFTTVFFTSALFLQYNLFWKNTLFVGKKLIANRLFHFAVNAVFVIVVSVLLMEVTKRLFPIEPKRTYFVFYVLRHSLIAFVAIMVAHAIELVEKLKHEQIRFLLLKQQHSETELAALKAQIDPHFFFNALSSLNILIREDTKEALAFVNHLSETFRYILNNREANFATVEEEMKFLESYLFMMNKRFSGSLTVSVDVAAEYRAKKIPHFALQILVENAIKHNQLSEKKPLHVAIASGPDGLVVTNNLRKKQTVQGFGIGLSNLSKRYQMISDLDITVHVDQQFFQVKLPFL